jgi:predicted nucleic acid-binding protein
MTYLLDTNILVRLTDTQSAFHNTADVAVRQLQPNHQLAVVPQNLLNFGM